MDALLNFFSGLIVFTFGLAVALVWVGIIVVVSVELWDLIFGEPENEELE